MIERMIRLGIILLAVAAIAWCGGWEFQKRKMQKEVVAPLAQQKARTESALAESVVQRTTLERRVTRLCNLLDLNRYDLSGAAETELSIWVTGGGPGEIVYGTGATQSQERDLYLQRDHDNHRINIVDVDDQGGVIGYVYPLTDDVSFQRADLCDQSKAHLLAITPDKKKKLWGRLKSP
jgi:hypothetical protein